MTVRTADPRLIDRVPDRLRLGTRRSALARTQSQTVADALAAALASLDPHRTVDIELVDVTTAGDVSTASLASLGGTGVFATALREALLSGTIDVAVHSLKDLPTAPAPGLVLAALPPRADPRDALVARDGLPLAQLPPGSRVGTGSPRRAAQLRAHDKDLDVVDIRGNVDTRLRMVADGALDAVVLAHAGLLRLGRSAEVTQLFEPELMLPAPGQGALAVETRAGDGALIQVLGLLDDATTRSCVLAERALLARLEAGCAAPVGALAEPAADGTIRLHAFVGSPDGTVSIRRAVDVPHTGGSDPRPVEAAAVRLAGRMLADGAAELVANAVLTAATSAATGTSTSGEGDV